MPATPAHGRGIARLLGGAPPAVPDVVFRIDGREVPATGEVAYQRPYTPGTVAGVDVKRSRPGLLVPGADWDMYGARVGALVTVDGAEYVIASVERDESDLVEAMLRESR